jgi:hypothetical protein
MIKSACLFFCISFCLITHGQNSINPTGKFVSASNGSVEYSIGETFGNNASGASGSVKAGVIQPFILSVPTSLPNTNSDPAIRAFPNPVILNNLRIENPVYLHSTLIITDMQGRIVLRNIIETGLSDIDLSLLMKGTYIVKIYSKKNELLYSTKLLKL